MTDMRNPQALFPGSSLRDDICGRAGAVALDRVSLVKDSLVVAGIFLSFFGKVRQCRPQLLARSLVKETLQGFVSRFRSTAVGLDVGGNRVKTLVVVTGFCQ